MFLYLHWTRIQMHGFDLVSIVSSLGEMKHDDCCNGVFKHIYYNNKIIGFIRISKHNASQCGSLNYQMNSLLCTPLHLNCTKRF